MACRPHRAAVIRSFIQSFRRAGYPFRCEESSRRTNKRIIVPGLGLAVFPRSGAFTGIPGRCYSLCYSPHLVMSRAGPHSAKALRAHSWAAFGGGDRGRGPARVVPARVTAGDLSTCPAAPAYRGHADKSAGQDGRTSWQAERDRRAGRTSNCPTVHQPPARGLYRGRLDSSPDSSGGQFGRPDGYGT